MALTKTRSTKGSIIKVVLVSLKVSKQKLVPFQTMLKFLTPYQVPYLCASAGEVIEVIKSLNTFCALNYDSPVGSIIRGSI